MFKVQCTSCRETHDNYVGVNRFVSLLFCSLASVPGSSQFLNQELNEMSGSRGEANFVWRCKNCKVGFHDLSKEISSYILTNSIFSQRESTASIKTAPAPYEQGEPPKAQKLFEFDCRGLEFVEFKPEVCLSFHNDGKKSC
jgi:hypothetical protein